MFRSALLNNRITRLRQLERLRHFLQCALIIEQCSDALFRRLKIRNHALCNKTPDGIDPAIEINGCDDRLERVGQEGALQPAAASLLASAEQQEIANSDGL